MNSPNKCKQLRSDIVSAIHDAQLVEHGGLPGVRNLKLFELEDADTISIGAMYAIAIAHNHPFIDGNKRVAWTAMRTFLQLNGVTLAFERADAVHEMLALAAGERTDEQFIDWVRRHATG